MGGYKPPCGCWQPNPNPLEEQQVLLATKLPILASILSTGPQLETFGLGNSKRENTPIKSAYRQVRGGIFLITVW